MANKSKFVYTEGIEEALTLGMLSNKNVFLYGPPGHAKSEFTLEYLKRHFKPEEIFIQSFGEGMTEDRLWGGVDLKALDEGIVKYNTDNSFLNYEVAIFEEICDAPANMLVSMKDTLTAKVYRNGVQQIPMKTKFIIGLTNKRPDELNSLGDSYKALMERFPIQLEVKWDSYKADRYANLLKHYVSSIKKEDVMSSASIKVMAQFLGSIAEENTPISPRTVIHAVDILLATAAKRGSDSNVDKGDFARLKYLAGFEHFAKNIAEELERAQEVERVKGSIQSVYDQNLNLIKEAGACTSPIKLLQYCKQFKELENDLKGIQVPNDMVREIENLQREILDNYSRCSGWALANTRLEAK